MAQVPLSMNHAIGIGGADRAGTTDAVSLSTLLECSYLTILSARSFYRMNYVHFDPASPVSEDMIAKIETKLNHSPT